MSDERAELEARIREACIAEAWSDAATTALAGYGPELLGYLVAMTRDETAASDAFSIFSEHLWKGLPKFRWECSFRTWAYGLARHALGRWRRDPHRRRAMPLSDDAAEAIAADVRSQTATYLRTETKDKVAAIRAQLEPDDQTLLILRLNRQLPWRDIARILASDEEGLDEGEVTKRAASLRKRFERLKDDLRERVKSAS